MIVHVEYRDGGTADVRITPRARREWEAEHKRSIHEAERSEMSDWIDEVAWRSLVARHGESRDFDAWLDDLDAIYQVPDDPERYLMALCAGMSVESVDALVDSLQGVADRKRGQSGGPAGDTRDLVDPTGGEASTIGSPPSSSRPGSTTDTSTISQSENPVFSRRLSTTRSPVDL